MSFMQVMYAFLSRSHEGGHKMLFIVQKTNEKRLVGKLEKFINRWRAKTAVPESLAALYKRLEPRAMARGKETGPG